MGSSVSSEMSASSRRRRACGTGFVAMGVAGLGGGLWGCMRVWVDGCVGVWVDVYAVW